MALDPLLSHPNGEKRFPFSFTPDFQIVQVTGNGLVVRCSRSFEWGATLQLGVLLHIQLPFPGEGACAEAPACASNDSLLDVKGIVVDCHEVLSYPAACPQYEITLFYDSITEEQCAALLRASRQRHDLENPDKPDESGRLLFFDDPEGFERVCGLN